MKAWTLVVNINFQTFSARQPPNFGLQVTVKRHKPSGQTSVYSFAFQLGFSVDPINQGTWAATFRAICGSKDQVRAAT